MVYFYTSSEISLSANERKTINTTTSKNRDHENRPQIIFSSLYSFKDFIINNHKNSLKQVLINLPKIYVILYLSSKKNCVVKEI